MMKEGIDAGCLYCNKVLKGRTDKKYCNDICRNAFNNETRSTWIRKVRTINNALLKNRRILASIVSEDTGNRVINKDILKEMGFSFRYCTAVKEGKQAGLIYSCYEFNYLLLANGSCIISAELDDKIL